MPVPVLLHQHRPTSLVIAASLGKMPTTQVPRLIYSLTLSSRLVFQILRLWGWGSPELRIRSGCM